MAVDEAALIAAIVARSGLSGCEPLIAELSAAKVLPQTPWILDIKNPRAAAATTFSDGPFPVRALVARQAEYRGEVIIWISAGVLSGLEYAWTTDAPPSRWPLPHEVELIIQ